MKYTILSCVNDYMKIFIIKAFNSKVYINFNRCNTTKTFINLELTLDIMDLDSYSYKLPQELIAQKGLFPRDSCRLLILEDKMKIGHEKFRDIIKHLNPGDVLVLNDTKVLHSKLVGKKDSGNPAEVILLKKISERAYEAKIKTRNPHIGLSQALMY